MQISQMRTDYAAYESVRFIRSQQCSVAELVQIYSSEYGSAN